MPASHLINICRKHDRGGTGRLPADQTIQAILESIAPSFHSDDLAKVKSMLWNSGAVSDGFLNYEHLLHWLQHGGAAKGKQVHVFFLRHGESTWNVKHGTGDYIDVMKKYGLGIEAAVAAGADWNDWHKAMRVCLHGPGNKVMRHDPASPPPEDVRCLDELLTDPPLTLEGKRGLRACMPVHAQSICLQPFHVVVASPMLRTLQTATIAACGLPLAGHCKWYLDADAREENHTGWVDTWGTSSLQRLRARANAEIAAAGCQAEDDACRLRPPLQEQAITSGQGCGASEDLNRHVASQAGLLGAAPGGIKAFVSDMNKPVVPTAKDKEAAKCEALQWSRVVMSDPEFRYRADGLAEASQVVARLSNDANVRWWSLSESQDDVRKRVISVLQSDAVRMAQGPVLIVTHSQFTDIAIKTLVNSATRWVGPAEHPSKAKQLVANGGVFHALVDMSNLLAIEASVTEWRRSNM